MDDFRQYKFEFLERYRKKIRIGDVFVMKIKNRDLYFYGKVIDEIRVDRVKLALIFLYKTPTAEIVVPDDMDENDVMTVLLVLTTTWESGWNEGVFKNICNIPVKEEELNFDYGFYSSDNKDVYEDVHGNVRDHTPKIINKHDVSLISDVSFEISKYLHENPDVKKKYGLDELIESERAEDKELHLEFLEKSRKWIRNGDVFVMKIKGHDLYFYGKVIDTKASMGGFAQPYLIYLYKTPTTEIVVPDDMEENDVLTAVLGLRDGWSDGVFKTVCNIPVKEEEQSLDYGFYSPNHGAWITEEEVETYSENHEIDHL